jgi:L-seryl-tRNA(Ser) seleniumtransferase
LCLAALEATLDAHRRKAFEEIPALKMLALTAAAVEERASRLVDELSRVNPSDLMVEVIPGESAIGGGSAPGTHPQTALIALRHKQLSADELERKLRHAPTPVISRITEGQVTLDLRTVSETEEVALLDVLVGLTRHF